MNARYKNPDNDPRGVWKAGDLSVKTYSANTDYPITTPSGRIAKPPKGYCWRVSKEKLNELIEENRIWFGLDGNNVPAIKRFLTDVKDGITSMTIWTYDEVGHNQDAKKEVKEFNEHTVFDTPKPEKLLQKILTLASNENDLILDSFLGSGTTAAVAHKMNRRYIGIEMGEHAQTHCQPRLKKVIDGEQGGISKAINWQGGGGFRYYRLGETITDAQGKINPSIRYQHLAAHIWYKTTKTPLLTKPDTPLIGIHNDTAYYLLYNGILGDKQNNALTETVLKQLPDYNGNKIIYSEDCQLGDEILAIESIEFREIPYTI